MTALHLVLNELAICVLPTRQRAGHIDNLARRYGLDETITKALQQGDCEQLARLSNSRTTGCSFIVASNVPTISSGCHFIVAAEVPKH